MALTINRLACPYILQLFNYGTTQPGELPHAL